MSAPKAATGRIQLQYTVDNIVHHAHFFVRNVQAVGGSFNINSRATDANDTVWTDALARLTAGWGGMGGAGFSWGPALLEKKVGLAWQVLATHTPTDANSGGVQRYASQITLVFRDRSFYQVKVVALETIEVPLQHFTSPTGGDASMDAFIGQYVVGTGNPADMFNWLVGVSNQYLADNPFIGCTVTYNRKIARRRGLK